MSIRQLAMQSSIPYNTAVSALNHRGTISAKQLFSFAETLNVDVRELWYGKSHNGDNDKQNEDKEGGAMSNEFATKVLKDMAEMAEAASDPEKQAAFEEEMKRQDERRKQIDELCMQAMEAMGAAMECVQKVMVESSLSIHQIVDLSEQAAKLGGAMANLRMSMGGFGYIGAGCGCGV